MEFYENLYYEKKDFMKQLEEKKINKYKKVRLSEENEFETL